MISKEAIKELKEYSIIAKADKNNNFYLGIPTHCKVKKTKKTIKAIEKCLHLKKKYFHKKSVNKVIKNLDLLVMKDGGINLKMLAIMVDVMKVTRENSIKIKRIWIEMHKLFRGILLFQKHGIVHHDVKPQNIVYNIDDHVANFIDFGHMRNISNEIKKSIASDNWIYDYPFWNYPFEIQYLNKDSYMEFASKSDIKKDNIFTNLLDDIHYNSETKFVDAFTLFMDYIIHNKNTSDKKIILNKYLTEYHTMIMTQMNTERYYDFINKSISTIDVYGLGMSLYYLLNCSRNFLKSEIIVLMETCFFNMTTPNLLQRFTIQEATDSFEYILMESGFMDEFGLVFIKREIVKKNNKNNKINRKLNLIASSDISIHKMSKKRLKNAMYRPSCPVGYIMNSNTKKCVKRNNKTQKMF